MPDSPRGSREFVSSLLDTLNEFNKAPNSPKNVRPVVLSLADASKNSPTTFRRASVDTLVAPKSSPGLSRSPLGSPSHGAHSNHKSSHSPIFVFPDRPDPVISAAVTAPTVNIIANTEPPKESGDITPRAGNVSPKPDAPIVRVRSLPLNGLQTLQLPKPMVSAFASSIQSIDIQNSEAQSVVDGESDTDSQPSNVVEFI